jgi:hypothetical protein
MESRIDLDEAAKLISDLVASWKRDGFVLADLTWRDVGGPWPYPLKVNRAEVIDPDSVGVTLRKDAREGTLVLSEVGGPTLSTGVAVLWTMSSFEAPGWAVWMTLKDFERLLHRIAHQLGPAEYVAFLPDFGGERGTVVSPLHLNYRLQRLASELGLDFSLLFDIRRSTARCSSTL